MTKFSRASSMPLTPVPSQYVTHKVGNLLSLLIMMIYYCFPELNYTSKVWAYQWHFQTGVIYSQGTAYTLGSSSSRRRDSILTKKCTVSKLGELNWLLWFHLSYLICETELREPRCSPGLDSAVRHFYRICYLLLGVYELPVNISPRNKRKMVCLQEGVSGISPQTHVRFTEHIDLKTKHFILKKENHAMSLNMAHNQSLDPWCFTRRQQLPYKYAFNGTFITNNKHNGSCGGKSTNKCDMEKVLPLTHAVPHPSLVSP